MSRHSLETVVYTDPKTILFHETFRVLRCLLHQREYKKNGYNIGLPADLYPPHTPRSVRDIVTKEVSRNFALYEKYKDTFKQAWSFVHTRCLPIAEELYGYTITGRFSIIPTAYGSGGGQLYDDSPIYIRLPQFRSGSLWPSEEQFLVHEILAHRGTSHMRTGELSERSLGILHPLKERLMDAITAYILIRAGHPYTMNQRFAKFFQFPLFLSGPEEDELRSYSGYLDKYFDIKQLLISPSPRIIVTLRKNPN